MPESASARVATRLVNMGKEDAAAAKAEARAARGSDDAAVAAVLERVVGMLERRGAVYSGFLPHAAAAASRGDAPSRRGVGGTRLAAPSPSRVSPRSGTAEGGHTQHHRYQRHRAGAGKL